MTEILRPLEQFDEFSIDYFTQGKKGLDNDDLILLCEKSVTVLDGTTTVTPLLIDGLPSGTYASRTIATLLKEAPITLYGQELVDFISSGYYEHLSRLIHPEIFINDTKTRPSACMLHAAYIEDSFVITQVGDVMCRVNGEYIIKNDKNIDSLHAMMRQKVIQNMRIQNPGISQEELLHKGRAAVSPLINLQRNLYQNRAVLNGYGVIDGNPVPPELVQTFIFPATSIQSIEIATDGYFKAGTEPTIESWEQAFQEVEKEDPYKYLGYPSTKGSIPGVQYTDDRTIVILKKHNTGYSNL